MKLNPCRPFSHGDRSEWREPDPCHGIQGDVGNRSARDGVVSGHAVDRRSAGFGVHVPASITRPPCLLPLRGDPSPGTYRQADRTRGDDARGRATRTAAWPQVANRPAPLAHRRSAQASRRSGCSVRAGLLAAGYGERHGVPMPAGRRRILMADIRLDMLPRRAARTIMLGCSLFARLPRYGPSAPGMVRHFVTASLGRGVHGPAARDSLRYSLIPRRVVKIGLLIRGIRGSSPWRRTRLDLATRSPA